MTIALERPISKSELNIEPQEYSLEEFFAWLKENVADDRQFELINGEIVEKNAAGPNGPSGRHGEIMNNLGYYLKAHVLSHNLGRVFTDAPCQMPQLNPNTAATDEAQPVSKPKKASYLIPDVLFVKAGRIPDRFSGPVPVVPDFVAEINSPSDDGEHIKAKIELYRQAGVPLIWSIYLMEEFVAIYRLEDPDKDVLNLKGVLDGEEVIPEFKLKVSDLFK